MDISSVIPVKYHTTKLGLATKGKPKEKILYLIKKLHKIMS